MQVHNSRKTARNGSDRTWGRQHQRILPEAQRPDLCGFLSGTSRSRRKCRFRLVRQCLRGHTGGRKPVRFPCPCLRFASGILRWTCFFRRSGIEYSQTESHRSRGQSVPAQYARCIPRLPVNTGRPRPHRNREFLSRRFHFLPRLSPFPSPEFPSTAG